MGTFPAGTLSLAVYKKYKRVSPQGTSPIILELREIK